MSNPSPNGASILKLLPSLDELLSADISREIVHRSGTKRLKLLARDVMGQLRSELREELMGGVTDSSRYSRNELSERLEERLGEAWRAYERSGTRRVINATGVVIHTNLGRAPLSEKTVASVLREVANYCTLEYDLETGGRGQRGAYAESLLAELAGAEAALIVNNCAAAAFFVLSAFAKDGEVIVSRGELVEIGGDFRVPDVLASSGAAMVEIGTTNRTKLSDYEKAFTKNTRMVLRVHPSNYKIVGFTAMPSVVELAELTRRKKIILYEDAGSGALQDLSAFGLKDEPVIARSIADGADLVSFSGDKLLGGSQAGLIVGRKRLIEKLRREPLYRALRVDKSLSVACRTFFLASRKLQCYKRRTPAIEVAHGKGSSAYTHSPRTANHGHSLQAGPRNGRRGTRRPARIANLFHCTRAVARAGGEGPRAAQRSRPALRLYANRSPKRCAAIGVASHC